MRDRSTRRLGMDLMMLLFMSMGAILYMILPLINIPEEKVATAPPPQGNVIVELYWPDESTADVDLWVQAPGDVPVGYSNKGGRIFNLLRDDLGANNDISKRNMEISYSRGIPNGEYIINVHLFSRLRGELPLPVRIVISVKATDDAPYTPLFTNSTELTSFGEERTMARFRMKDGVMVPGSFNTIRKPIRSAFNLP